MTEKITAEQLIHYFENSKQEFWIGVQNFQGIRPYIQIPLAPITLLYGQNSAGKSTIHDALYFIHSFLGGKWDNKTTGQYLERWANHQRKLMPLAQGYLGNSDDVVISVSTYTTDVEYMDWESMYYKNQLDTRGIPSYQLFVVGSETRIPFQIYIHFSNEAINDKRTWYIRKFSLFLGDDNLIDYEVKLQKTDRDKKYLVHINKRNFIYTFLNSFFEKGIKSVLNEIKGFELEIINNNERIGFTYISDNEILEWKHPIDWFLIDAACDDYCGISTEMQWLRALLNSLLIVPAMAASTKLDFISIPPLRPIPAKQTAIFRKFSGKADQNIHEFDCWSKLALQVCLYHISSYYNKVEDAVSEHLKKLATLFNDAPYHDNCSVLVEVNRILSHPLFLNTDYEISGECLFLTPINGFHENTNKTNEEVYALLNNLDAEIHLKIRQKSNGHLFEIEDVGVGISQIIPVLYAIVSGHRVFIQQPELHLHPKLQAQLADAFIERFNKAQGSFFVIESHSEHFLLRLLRRIRETFKSDIKNKLFSLSPEHVSVLYVDKLADGSSKVIPLRISKDGEFIDRWPNGFFTERDGELFDE